MMRKVIQFFFFLAFLPEFGLGQIPDSLNQSSLRLPDKECFITFTILGGYGGYMRLGYDFKQEESGIKIQEFIMNPIGDSIYTRFDKNGKINSYLKPDLFRKEKFIPNDAAEGLISTLIKLDSLGQQTVPDFDAALYCSSKGGCSNMGGWAHYESNSKSIYIFDSSVYNSPLLDLLENILISMSPPKQKRKRSFLFKKK